MGKEAPANYVPAAAVIRRERLYDYYHGCADVRVLGEVVWNGPPEWVRVL